jgi:hypothetical protein
MKGFTKAHATWTGKSDVSDTIGGTQTHGGSNSENNREDMGCKGVGSILLT